VDADDPGGAVLAVPAWLARARETGWRLVVSTVASSMRHRVTGLAAEAAFFTVLSVPPLLFALTGAIGYVTESFSPGQVDHVRTAILDLASRFLTDSAVHRVIQPTIDDVLRGGRFDVVSVGFVLALWSGSRAMHVDHDHERARRSPRDRQDPRALLRPLPAGHRHRRGRPAAGRGRPTAGA
jgi:membrane protein